MKSKRNTLQKQIVYSTFSDLRNHPSAGMVYEAVLEKYPGISKATVYRLLAEAAEEGKIQRLKLTDANDRYDFTLGRHYHVVCRSCGAVSDVTIDVDGAKLTELAENSEGFLIEDCHVEFSGICDKCNNQN